MLTSPTIASTENKKNCVYIIVDWWLSDWVDWEASRKLIRAIGPLEVIEMLSISSSQHWGLLMWEVTYIFSASLSRIWSHISKRAPGMSLWLMNACNMWQRPSKPTSPCCIASGNSPWLLPVTTGSPALEWESWLGLSLKAGPSDTGSETKEMSFCWGIAIEIQTKEKTKVN